MAIPSNEESSARLHARNLTLRPIETGDIAALIEHERKVYPHTATDAYYPTEDTFLNWFLRDTVNGVRVTHVFNRQLAMIYTYEEEAVAACIFMPLNQSGMDKLCTGEWNEVDLDPVLDMFRIPDSGQDTGQVQILYLHVYHVCWFNHKGRGLFERVLRDTGDIIRRWRLNTGQPIRVGGFSGYAVSPAGLSLFEHKLNCREREKYIAQEHVLVKRNTETGQEEVCDIIETDDHCEIYKYIKHGWEYRCRCRFVVTYPTEVSLVWHYIDSTGEYQ